MPEDIIIYFLLFTLLLAQTIFTQLIGNRIVLRVPQPFRQFTRTRIAG